jgi:hypothetical protein
MHVNPKRRGRRSDEDIIMVGEAGSKRPPGEGKELIQTNSFIENSIEAGTLLGKEHKERGTMNTRACTATNSTFFRASACTLLRMLHGGFLACSYKSKTLEIELLLPEVIAQILLFDELYCGKSFKTF